MNYIMKIRRKNKMSREELSHKLNRIPLSLLITYETAKNPVLPLSLKERFKTIFNLSEEELENEIEAAKHP